MKIYTKVGDRGDTRLFDGSKTRKDDPRVDAYGDVDELNSFIGAAASGIDDPGLLALLSDDEYEAGLRRIEAALDRAEADNREIEFAAELPFVMITARQVSATGL